MRRPFQVFAENDRAELPNGSERIARGRRRRVVRRILAILFVSFFADPLHAFDDGADGHFEKRESSHFVLFQDVDIDQTSGLRGSRRFEQRVLEVLESAYRDADEQLGLRPERQTTVILYDPRVFESRFQGLFRFPAAGFYQGQIHIRGDEVVSPRLVRVLRHEFIHAAFDAEAPSVQLPGWLNEGVAEFFEIPTTAASRLSSREWQRLRQAQGRGRLFSLEGLSGPSFASLEGSDARLAYLQSSAFIEYLYRSQGERRVRGWLADLLRKGNLDRATRRNFRLDLSELQEQFRMQLAGTSG